MSHSMSMSTDLNKQLSHTCTRRWRCAASWFGSADSDSVWAWKWRGPRFQVNYLNSPQYILFSLQKQHQTSLQIHNRSLRNENFVALAQLSIEIYPGPGSRRVSGVFSKGVVKVRDFMEASAAAEPHHWIRTRVLLCCRLSTLGKFNDLMRLRKHLNLLTLARRSIFHFSSHSVVNRTSCTRGPAELYVNSYWTRRVFTWF